MTGKLTLFAAENQQKFHALTSPAQRKEQGHFSTPPIVAEFMASLFFETASPSKRILDPGAGVGILSAAICDRVLSDSVPQRLYFELYETDLKLIPLLEETMCRCQALLREAGHEMEFLVRIEDFILANTGKSLFDHGPIPSFHQAILNPPYFKLRKDSPQAKAMAHIVHGQPNIYALFLAAAADLLVPSGQLVAITPRSYFNGTYFKKFRHWFFDRLTVRQIHAFESRTETFKQDAVLQESVILHAEKEAVPKDILLTTSMGQDASKSTRNRVPYASVLHRTASDCIVRISKDTFEQSIIEAVDHLPQSFRSLSYEISTGPVVTFRCTDFLRFEQSKDTAPLLWMHNVAPFSTRLGTRNGKPSHIVVNKQSAKLLLAAKTYVIVKRFSAREEKRRIVAGILNANDSYSKWVGLENHLNYMYRFDQPWGLCEAYGVAAYFNSILIDKYFRSFSGSTQVNATEVRTLPMPERQTLIEIGKAVQATTNPGIQEIEHIVGQALGLPSKFFDQLIEEVG